MSKLNGIRDSKRRLEAHKRALERRTPPESRPITAVMARHQPIPHVDGSIQCAACGAMRFSPAAYAAHLAGRPMLDAERGVYTVGPSDAWLAAKQADQQKQISEDTEAVWRAELVDACYKQRRSQPIAEGADPGMFD